MKGKIRTDIYLISPDGKRIRSEIELEKYLKENPNIKCDLEVTSTTKTKHREFLLSQGMKILKLEHFLDKLYT